MANRKVALPSVPRGLARDLTNFLEALLSNVRILSGEARGSEGTEAVRAEDLKYYTGGTSQSAEIANSSISTEKLENKSVTTAKIVDEAVTTAKIENNAVTIEKMDTSALLSQYMGEAINEELVVLPNKYTGTPSLFLTLIDLEQVVGVTKVGISELTKDETTQLWQFKAIGNFSYTAIGYVYE